MITIDYITLAYWIVLYMLTIFFTMNRLPSTWVPSKIHVYVGQLFFACRCVIGELFLDGKPMFDLSQLLRYSSGEKEFSENTLKKISDKFIRVRGRWMAVTNEIASFGS